MPTLISKHHPKRVSQKAIRQAVETTLIYEGVKPRTVEVSVVLVDDVEIQTLNREYRHIDKPTDVLSFSQEDDFIIPGKTSRLLGDVVISVDTAEKQAETAGQSLDNEVCQLAIHGVLHLLGYDDAITEDYETMVRKGAEIWGRING